MDGGLEAVPVGTANSNPGVLPSPAHWGFQHPPVPQTQATTQPGAPSIPHRSQPLGAQWAQLPQLPAVAYPSSTGSDSRTHDVVPVQPAHPPESTVRVH